MKNLSQIREETEHLVTEKNNKFPNINEIPLILIFRRKTYRIYPNNQVVALYYSSALDKYLSIPFGETGNLNLSEEELEEGVIGDTIEKGRKYLHDKLKDNKTFRAIQKLPDAAKSTAETGLKKVGGTIEKTRQ